ncbi:MAG: hypothetical protein M3004_06090 [Bacteroidota bacterium]|nr:hypothetical protein [Bacteroidota bacterium]
MKTNSTQQEILLITGTSFSARQWCEKDEEGNQKHLTEKEQLEEACWNGLLQEILPEITIQTNVDKKIYLWQVKEAASFIELEFGEAPEEKENYFSIDPYSFMPIQLLS